MDTPYNPQAAEFAEKERVFYHDRQEMEFLAAAIEAMVKMVYYPEVRAGERDNANLMEACDHYTAYCRELIEEADTQDRSNEPSPMAGNELPLDRDSVRYLAYGIIHILQCIKDRQEETAAGDAPEKALTGMMCGLWILVDRWEQERRTEVYERMDRLDNQVRGGETPSMFKLLPMPADWNPTGDIPEE